jgi:hypothetical protein
VWGLGQLDGSEAGEAGVLVPLPHVLV